MELQTLRAALNALPPSRWRDAALTASMNEELPFAGSESPPMASVDELIKLYQRRLEHVRKHSVDVVGMEELLDVLRQMPAGSQLAIAPFVGATKAVYAFFDEGGALVSCLTGRGHSKPFARGAVIEVVVSSVKQFGILVDFEGAEGVILLPNIYWDYHDGQRRMFEDFRPGQKLLVKVLVVAPRQFSASLREVHPEENPWKDPSLYAIGTVHQGIVDRIFERGQAIVRLENGAQIIVPNPKPGIRMNDRVSVRVIELDISKQWIDAEQL